jgi:hypothetical protein
MELCVLSREAAERYEPKGLEICISIADPTVTPARLSPGFAAVLRLNFSDIIALESPEDVLFDTDHAAAIVEFVQQWAHADRLVVHCHVGASRSPGVALGLCDRFGWPAAELERSHPAWNRWIRQRLAGHCGSSPRADSSREHEARPVSQRSQE